MIISSDAALRLDVDHGDGHVESLSCAVQQELERDLVMQALQHAEDARAVTSSPVA